MARGIELLVSAGLARNDHDRSQRPVVHQRKLGLRLRGPVHVLTPSQVLRINISTSYSMINLQQRGPSWKFLHP